MSCLVRFAPSPTGYLHVGNVRTALVNWLFARKAGGHFMLRLDDTDADRSKPEYAAAIEEDLNWLGLVWDDFKKQSDRMDAYAYAAKKLMQAGRLYPCFETQEELDMRRRLQAGRGMPPIYDRASLKLSAEQKSKYEAEGRKPHFRFLLKDEPIVWDDLIRGEVRIQGAHVSDPVLVREDGVPLYTLASVVDDGDMGITHIIRGEDHVSNTAVQVQIFEALGHVSPQFGHLALLKTKEGELSKRMGGSDIRSLREAGFEPMAITSLLAKIGTSDPVEPFMDTQALTEAFDISKFGRAPAHYDIHELERLNEKLLHHLPFSAVRDRIAFADEHFWLALRSNFKTLADARQWWDILHAPLAYQSGDPDYLRAASGLLPPEPWNEQSWGVWTKAIADSTGRKGKALFMPLRLALTGQEHGPEMKIILPMLEPNVVKQRLTHSAS